MPGIVPVRPPQAPTARSTPREPLGERDRSRSGRIRERVELLVEEPRVEGRIQRAAREQLVALVHERDRHEHARDIPRSATPRLRRALRRAARSRSAGGGP